MSARTKGLLLRVTTAVGTGAVVAGCSSSSDVASGFYPPDAAPRDAIAANEETGATGSFTTDAGLSGPDGGVILVVADASDSPAADDAGDASIDASSDATTE